MCRTGYLNMLRGLLILTVFATGAGWADNLVLVTNPSGQGANDSLSWAQLGSDGTILPQSFVVQSSKGIVVNVPLAGQSSVISVVCGSAPCSWTEGMGLAPGDSLLWTSDAGNGGNGPVMLNFARNVAGAGAFIQANGPGPFTVQVQAFNGPTLLGSFMQNSDGNGDAVYIGVLDQTDPNITAVVFSVINCVSGSVCSDFAIDTVGVNAASGGQNNFTLTLAVNPAGAGSITANPPSNNGVYASGTKVCLRASANSGWTFSSWSGDPLDGSYCLTMDGNKWETANFETTTALQFVPVTPCRLLDTRPQNGGSGPIQGSTFQTFDLPQLALQNGCSNISAATAYSLNVTVVPEGRLGYLTIWPSGQSQPVVSTLNSYDGRVKAVAAIVPGGASAAVSVFVTDTTDVILDIDGYFTAPSQQTLQFYPLPPCRVADTRDSTDYAPGLGAPYLMGNTEHDFPVLNAAMNKVPCVIPNSAQAYSMNFTAVPHGLLAYLTVWPTGENQPVVSTLNSYGGQVTANAAIVPAGMGGEISAFVTNDTDLVIDINGYFAPGPGGFSLYPSAPCRVIDTRTGSGPFNGKLNPPVDPVNSPCAVPAASQADVFNATVVPTGVLGYLTLWPVGQMQPVVSTLNAYDGIVTSNMAIVPTGTQGMINAYAEQDTAPTNLILDISSYFAP